MAKLSHHTHGRPIFTPEAGKLSAGSNHSTIWNGLMWVWKGLASGAARVSLASGHSSVAPNFIYSSISPLNCLPLIVCIGGAFGIRGGVGDGVGEFRPPVLPIGVGVGLGLANWPNWDLGVLKRNSRLTMPMGATMSARNPGCLGNSALLGKGTEFTAA